MHFSFNPFMSSILDYTKWMIKKKKKMRRQNDEMGQVKRGMIQLQREVRKKKKVEKQKVKIFVLKRSKDKYKVLRRRWEILVGIGEKSKGKGWLT